VDTADLIRDLVRRDVRVSYVIPRREALESVFIQITGNGFPLIIVTELVGTIAPLFALFLSGLLVTGELADGTIKLSLLRPIRRISFVAAKFIGVAGSVGVFLAVSFGASLVIGIIFFGWSGDFVFLGATLGWPQGALMVIATYALAALPRHGGGNVLF
jgi:ABC-2 type transport system permease protein